MATIEPAPRRISQLRSKLTLLPLYYDGFLWIKRPRSKEAKYWTELRGTKLFLYNDKKQEKYTDSIELQNLISVRDGYSNQKQWAEVVLTLETEEVTIKTEVAEDAEEWKGFILTVVQQVVPNWLTLLPGQLIRLKEVLENEVSRRAEEKSNMPSNSGSSAIPRTEAYEDVETSNAMPQCFYEVSRQEAAEMLIKNESFGNLIVRPGADGKNYAVTIREPSDKSKTQIKHYRILSTDRGFNIELDKPVTLASLTDVVNHFIKETKGKLKPYVSHIYDTQIDYAVNGGNQKTSALRGKENTYVNVFPGN